MVDVNKPVTNPLLVSAIEKMNADNNKFNVDQMIQEMLKANFLLPVKLAEKPSADAVDSDAAKKNTKMSLSTISGKDNTIYFPAFTDQVELRKWIKDGPQDAVVFTFKEYSSLILRDITLSGFIINPCGNAVVVSRSNIESINAQIESQNS